jgi:hypothetical protein
MMKVRPPKPTQNHANTSKSPQAQGILLQWFPQWWGWQSNKATNNSTSSATGSSTFDGELLDVLSDTIDDDTLLRRDTVFGLFNFALSKGAISLCTVSKNQSGGIKYILRISLSIFLFPLQIMDYLRITSYITLVRCKEDCIDRSSLFQ